MLDLYLDFFERPQAALRRVWASQPVGAGLLAYSLAGASLLFAQAFLGPLPSPRWMLWAVALWCVWEILTGLMTAAAVHFAAEWMGARASGSGLFVLLGMSELVWALAVPLTLILEAFRVQGPGQVLVFLGLGAASFALKLRSVRDHYGLTAGKAAAALIAPYALYSAATFVFFIIGVWTLAALAHGFFS